MFNFIRRWLETKPAENDPAPSFKNSEPVLSPEDDADTRRVVEIRATITCGDGQDEPDASFEDELDDVFTMIEYVDANLVTTRRRITMRKFSTSGAPALVAFCHERKAIRTFRLDRIRCFIAPDGEIIEPSDFWRSIDVTPPPFKKPRSAAELVAERPIENRRQERDNLREFHRPDRSRPQLDVRHHVRHQVRILTALARADGHLHERESLMITDYALDEGERIGISLTPSEEAAFELYVRRLRPTREKLEESILRLCGGADGSKGLDPAARDRFVAALQTVALADGVLDEAEAAFIEHLTALIAPPQD